MPQSLGVAPVGSAPQTLTLPVTVPPRRPTPGPAVIDEGPSSSAARAAALRSDMRRLAPDIARAQARPNSLAGQQASLGILHELGLIDAATLAERRRSLAAREGQPPLVPVQTGTLPGNALWSLIHPARHVWGASRGRLMEPQVFLEALARARTCVGVRPTTFDTDDGVQLSAWVVSPGRRRDSEPAAAARVGARPLVVMAGGNASCAELEITFAQAHARLLDVDVLLYNPRGVGLSLGDVTHPRQSLLDCRAALCHATTQAERVLVWGGSLGAGLATHALDDLVARAHPCAGRLEGMVCVNTFATLPAVMGQMGRAARVRAPWGRGASSAGLWLLGIDPLRNVDTLPRLATRLPVCVFNSSQDEMMRDDASLATALSRGAALPGRLEAHLLAAGDHNDTGRYLRQPAYLDALRAWRSATAQSSRHGA